MKWFASIGLLLFFCAAQAQEKKMALRRESVKLDQLLAQVERTFEVQYSYLDSIVADVRVEFQPQNYTLSEINSAIENQTALKVVQIDARYFSIYRNETIKAEELQEILVESLLSKGISKKSAVVVLSPQKVEILPGVTDADVLLSLQQLPGVKSPNETATGLHIRGNTPDQNLILWDGIRMYHPGHLFGMISGFNPNVRQTVRYYNKATDARYGERVSGTIDIRTQDQIAKETVVDAGINGLHADACVQLPLLKDRLDVQLSGRKSYTEWWQSPTFDALAKKVFQHTDFNRFEDDNRFGYEDYNVKFNYRPFSGTKLAASGIIIDNELDFKMVSGVHEIMQWLDVRNLGYSLGWEQQYGPRLRHSVLWYYSGYRFDYQKRRNFSSDDYEAFDKKNRITDSGVTVDFDYDFSQRWHWNLGYQLSGNALSHDFTAKNEGFSINLDQKQFFFQTHSAYLQTEGTLGLWQFLGGLRWNHYHKIDANDLEPRVLVQRKFTESLVWQSSFERKSQVVSQVRENVSNDLSLENYVWVLADGGQYPVQRANQFTTGLIFKPGHWLIDADWYYKTIDGITSQTFGFMQQYDAVPLRGEGSTKGFDLLVQKNGPNWRAWLTYTYQDSRNRFESVNRGKSFETSTNITHALGISAFRKWQRFSVTAGWFWHCGKPFSALDVDGRVMAYNASRLPVYHRLDVSALYVFRKAKSWHGKIGASVTNVYNRRSVISKEYEREYANINDFFGLHYSTQDYYGLGIMPNIFLRFTII
ncbi:TonB-dependent receptor plug domain-containing protein [Flavobacterium sp.]|uniref:TonB-dependent receptor plug domain-containing protein n=1 Tax=Flavobacterium sp. TaxID=239 RepID=UPI0039E4117C